ncbi:MAG: hypothetical protein WCJ03_11380 [Bacteroidales bacterium]
MQLTEDDLITDKGIFIGSSVNYHLEKPLLKKGRIKSIDVFLKDKLYIIRLSDGFESKQWKLLNDPENYGKTIEIKFLPESTGKTILYNPIELSLDNTKLLSLSDDKKTVLWMTLAFIIIALIAAFTTYLSFNTYREELLNYDKEIAQKNIFKLIWVWVSE